MYVKYAVICLAHGLSIPMKAIDQTNSSPKAADLLCHVIVAVILTMRRNIDD
jgi:hypothetical protein